MQRAPLSGVAIAALLALGLPAAGAVETAAPNAGVMMIADAPRTVMQVEGEYANLRSAPSTKAKLIARLNHGTKVEVLAHVSHGSWLKVKAGRQQGYIKATLLKPVTVPS
jgi:uncharacterized protein YgiM (DUF1202 family)